MLTIHTVFTATQSTWHWDWTVPPDAITANAVMSLVLAGILDYFGIGPDAWCDRIATIFVLTGISGLMTTGNPHVNTIFLRWLHMHAQWAYLCTEAVGIAALAMLYGCLAPPKAAGRLGRAARFELRRKKSGARFNPRVWILPGVVAAFPVSSGLIGMATYPIVMVMINVGQAVTGWLTGWPA